MDTCKKNKKKTLLMICDKLAVMCVCLLSPFAKHRQRLSMARCTTITVTEIHLWLRLNQVL